MDRKDIKAIRLVGTRKRTSNSYGRNLPYMSYRVFITNGDDSVNTYKPIEEMVDTQELKKDLSYWSTRSNTMAMTCWGTSQLFEAQIALGRWLKFDEKDWPAFSSKVTIFITEF